MCLMEQQSVPRKTVTRERNTSVISVMQNSSVYPKSTRDEAHFPFIRSIAIPCSTSYRTSGLTSFRKLQRLTETPVSGLYVYKFQYSKSKKDPCTPYRPKMRTDSLSLTEEVFQLSTSTSREVSLSSRDVRVTLWFRSQVEWTPRGHDSKEGTISQQWLKFRLVFHLTR